MSSLKRMSRDLLKQFEEEHKDALSFLRSSDISSPNKPIVAHDERVAFFLYQKGFDRDVVTASILHDLLEWSTVSAAEIEENFGNTVRILVEVLTKDKTITDKESRQHDQIERIVACGEGALAIKFADAWDSYQYYLNEENDGEVARAQKWIALINGKMSASTKERFVEELSLSGIIPHTTEM